MLGEMWKVRLKRGRQGHVIVAAETPITNANVTQTPREKSQNLHGYMDATASHSLMENPQNGVCRAIVSTKVYHRLCPYHIPRVSLRSELVDGVSDRWGQQC